MYLYSIVFSIFLFSIQFKAKFFIQKFLLSCRPADTFRAEGGWQAYTTPTVRGICTFAVFFSVSRPFCSFTLIYEGHSVLCYKEKIELLDRVMANFERSSVCLISAVICMSLRWVWHLYNLPCVSVLFWLISIARYIFKSKNLLLRDKIWRLPWTCCLLALYIVTPGPATIRTVCKYNR